MRSRSPYATPTRASTACPRSSSAHAWGTARDDRLAARQNRFQDAPATDGRSRRTRLRARGADSTFFHLPAVGEEVRLLTHLVVREDAHVLYAFATEEERRLFRSLIRVSGVGPKIALALLSGISVSAFIRSEERRVGK